MGSCRRERCRKYGFGSKTCGFVSTCTTSWRSSLSSGAYPRQPGTNAILVSIRDGDGNPLEYDIKAQTRAVVENIARILEEAGSSMEKVVDVTSFLVDMDDFAGYNEVWAETLGHYTYAPHSPFGHYRRQSPLK